VSLSNDATLDELCDRFYQQTLIKVSRPTLCRALQKLQLARRKTVHLNQQDTSVEFSSSKTESKHNERLVPHRSPFPAPCSPLDKL
jgi:hypothetical protein